MVTVIVIENVAYMCINKKKTPINFQPTVVGVKLTIGFFFGGGVVSFIFCSEIRVLIVDECSIK